MFKIKEYPYLYLKYEFIQNNYLRICFNVKHSLLKDNIILEHEVIASEYFVNKDNFVNTLFKFRELSQYV